METVLLTENFQDYLKKNILNWETVCDRLDCIFEKNPLF